MVEQPFMASNDSFFGAFDELLAIFLEKNMSKRRGENVFFASFSNFLDPQLNFVKKYIIKWAMVFFNLPWWTLKNFVKKAGYNDVGTKNVARCRGLNFRFQRRFVYKKKLRKKQNMCAAMFVCLFCRTVSSYTRNNYSGRSGLKYNPILPKKFGGWAGTV